MDDTPSTIVLYERLLDALKQLLEIRTEEEQKYNWHLQARPNQLPPQGDWRVWLIMAGRGFGKTRTGAETIRLWAQEEKCHRIALVAETESDARQVMIEGESGILATHPPGEQPLYEPSKRQLTWSNGTIATCYSAEFYEQLRGPQFDAAWVDELAKFRDAEKVWDQLMFSLRLGRSPRVIVTTTPKPIPLLKQLLLEPDVIVTRGSTFENAQHLAPPFLAYMRSHYEHTLLGRQELHAEIIEENCEALWTPKLIEQAKRSYRDLSLKRIVLSVDPAVSAHKKSDETGIIAAGLNEEGYGVVLADFSLKAPPYQWAQRTIEAYHNLKADRVIAEVNMGGDLVEHMLRVQDPQVSFKAVRANRSKYLRAEPIAALYQQGKIWHKQTFPSLEKQMLEYSPSSSKNSPDRLDALVWGLTELMLNQKTPDLNVWRI